MIFSVALAAEGTPLGKPGLPTCRLAEDRLAAWADHNSLGVAENSSAAITRKVSVQCVHHKFIGRYSLII